MLEILKDELQPEGVTDLAYGVGALVANIGRPEALARATACGNRRRGSWWLESRPISQ